MGISTGQRPVSRYFLKEKTRAIHRYAYYALLPVYHLSRGLGSCNLEWPYIFLGLIATVTAMLCLSVLGLPQLPTTGYLSGAIRCKQIPPKHYFVVVLRDWS